MENYYNTTVMSMLKKDRRIYALDKAADLVSVLLSCEYDNWTYVVELDDTQSGDMYNIVAYDEDLQLAGYF
jgi:hypothetical protein